MRFLLSNNLHFLPISGNILSRREAIRMSEFMHDLVMLRLQNENVKGMTNEELLYEYKNVETELLEADRKYYKEHPKKSGTWI
jgi:hypothetical protein